MDGTVVAEEPARTLALGKAWQRTFSAKDFNEEEAEKYLQSLGNFGEYSGNLTIFLFSLLWGGVPLPPQVLTVLLWLGVLQLETLALCACRGLIYC